MSSASDAQPVQVFALLQKLRSLTAEGTQVSLESVTVVSFRENGLPVLKRINPSSSAEEEIPKFDCGDIPSDMSLVLSVEPARFSDVNIHAVFVGKKPPQGHHWHYASDRNLVNPHVDFCMRQDFRLGNVHLVGKHKPSSQFETAHRGTWVVTGDRSNGDWIGQEREYVGELFVSGTIVIFRSSEIALVLLHSPIVKR